MALKAAAVGILLGLGVMPAMAQPGYYYGPPPGYGGAPIRGLSTRHILRTVREAGLRPIAQPRRVGPNYVVSSVDRQGVVKRVIIDAEMGEIVHIRAASGPIGGPRPPAGIRDGYAVLGPDAGPPRPRARIPGVHPPKPAHRKDENAVASVPPAAAPAPESARPKEADTESLPKSEGAVTAPASPPPSDKPESTASLPGDSAAAPAEAPRASTPKPPRPARSATVMPAKPPLPVRRPSQPAESAVAKPDEAAKATTASAPRVVLPGGPATKDEAASTAAAKREETSKAAPSAEAPAVNIVPPQSYE